MTWRDGVDGHDLAAGSAAAEAARIVRSRVDLSGLPPLCRAVTEQIICASADLTYATDLVCSEPWLLAAASALAEGAPLIADSAMVGAGISGYPLICKAGEPLTARLSRTAGISPAAAAVRLALGEAGPGAIWVVGSEPAAIYEILARGASPALVIGMPAGFAGTAEAKQALRDSGAPCLTNLSEKGGPAVAAAGCMALLRCDQPAG